ncbi:MAG: hypothetical protein HY553_04760 [Elusimicrobia bacterium]|nr:hypothetical protein [Elusimicrobiota bacterium]
MSVIWVGAAVAAMPAAAAALLACRASPSWAGALACGTLVVGGVFCGYLWQVYDWAWATLLPPVLGGGLFAASLRAASYSWGHALGTSAVAAVLVSGFLGINLNVFQPLLRKTHVASLARAAYGESCDRARLKAGLFDDSSFARWAAIVRLKSCKAEAHSLAEELGRALFREPASSNRMYVDADGLAVLSTLGSGAAPAARVLLASDYGEHPVFAVRTLVAAAEREEEKLALLRALAAQQRLLPAVRGAGRELGYADERWEPR